MSETRVRFLHLTAPLAIALVCFSFGTSSTLAQTANVQYRTVHQQKATFYKKRFSKRKLVARSLAASQNKAAQLQAAEGKAAPAAPVAVVNRVETDYLSGEASVVVNPKQPTVVRLGLSQNAVSIVEFPAADGVYYIHEGNPKMASVFQSPTKETDRSITIYPGEAFVAARDNFQNNPSATITLQMRSGLVLILELVPVTDLRRNAHRCVINYNREEVIAARRTAGLDYNLGEESKPGAIKNAKAVSKLVGTSIPETQIAAADQSSPQQLESQPVAVATAPPIRLAALDVTKGAVGRQPNDDSRSRKTKSGAELSLFVNRRLADCLKNPVKNLGAWSPEKHGLTLAASRAVEIDQRQRIVVVAVRNTATANVRLVQGTPELQILTGDKDGNPLQTERLPRTYVETTSPDGLILPGSTVYYALVYDAPVMGASQRLSVLAAHTEAADAPAFISLSTAEAGKE